jgi:hypothetical protein
MKILNLRQELVDALKYLQSLDVVPLDKYRYLYARLEACNYALMEYRTNYKMRDVGA